ncbi:TetR family transcriptional regulator [Planobispora rosea]|uniref:TetR family transcriptional regulator n=1 Tax=Planobispora rosea TaxID=35762 RepID=A0A8J3S1Q2_PLARO|nr:TetR/AcrR family transcriptional regulator [Planobispora rosea]GGS57101.1 TetR family transcriptional regulator [Planobispora rosea]GIH83454.1 TetR family transcriptional regulator [Planobispora rosea]
MGKEKSQETAGLRADARRNRDLIVAAARRLLLEQGADVPMEEVARRAGVGIGTLYRRFPDRDALLHAVGEESLRRLLDLAETAWREEPDAWHALRRFLRTSGELRLGALPAKLEPHLFQRLRTGRDLHELRQRVIALVLRMTERAQADGALRADIGPGDIALLMTLNVYTPPGAPDEQAMARVMEIMLDGLRAGPAAPAPPLPGAPFTGDDLRRHTAVAPTAEPTAEPAAEPDPSPESEHHRGPSGGNIDCPP